MKGNATIKLIGVSIKEIISDYSISIENHWSECHFYSVNYLASREDIPKFFLSLTCIDLRLSHG